MPKRRKPIEYKVVWSVEGQDYKNFDDIPAKLKEKILSNMKKAHNESIDSMLNKVPYELRDGLFFALIRIIHENNLTGIFSNFDAMEILVKMSKENHPDLEKYFTEPIPEIIKVKGKDGSISYQYSPSVSTNDP